MRRASSPPGALRPPGMQKRRYSSGVRVSRMSSVVAPALAARQLVGVDGGHVVLHLDLLAEVLAGHVHAPLGGRFWLAQRLTPPSSTATRR